MDKLLTMSEKEINRLEVIKAIEKKKIAQEKIIMSLLILYSFMQVGGIKVFVVKNADCIKIN